MPNLVARPLWLTSRRTRRQRPALIDADTSIGAGQWRLILVPLPPQRESYVPDRRLGSGSRQAVSATFGLRQLLGISRLPRTMPSGDFDPKRQSDLQPFPSTPTFTGELHAAGDSARMRRIPDRCAVVAPAPSRPQTPLSDTMIPRQRGGFFLPWTAISRATTLPVTCRPLSSQRRRRL